MNELMSNLLRDKQVARQRLVNLPIEEKLVLMERMRDRARLLASNPLRKRSQAPPPENGGARQNE